MVRAVVAKLRQTSCHGFLLASPPRRCALRFQSCWWAIILGMMRPLLNYPTVRSFCRPPTFLCPWWTIPMTSAESLPPTPSPISMLWAANHWWLSLFLAGRLMCLTLPSQTLSFAAAGMPVAHSASHWPAATVLTRLSPFLAWQSPGSCPP